MKKILLIVIAFMSITASSNANLSSAQPGGQTAQTGSMLTSIQANVPDPSKSQVTASMTGTIVFSFGAAKGTGIDITNWFSIYAFPHDNDLTYYYNTDSTKTFDCLAGAPCTIFVNQVNVNSVTVTFGAGTNYVQGM